MKIIHLVQKSQLRGAEIFASQLCTHLANCGHKVLLISVFQGDATLPFIGTKIHLNRPLKKRLTDYTGWKHLANIMDEHHPDIIQANAGDTLKFAVASKKIFGWHTPIMFRNANKMSDFINNKAKFYLNRYLLNTTVHIASVSDTCRNDIIDYFSIAPQKVTTIEIGIDFRPVGEVPGDLLPIFRKGPVYLNVASLVPEKNHGGLLRIFAALQKRVPDAQLIIIGKGKLEEALRVQQHQLGLQDQVHFLGYRNDVMEIMAGSTAFLLPSLIEGLPAVILEAMWAKCPVVSYNVGGIGDVIQQENTGLLAEKGDEEGFATQVLKLRDTGVRQTIISRAYQHVSEKYDNRGVAARFSHLYEQCVTKQE